MSKTSIGSVITVVIAVIIIGSLLFVSIFASNGVYKEQTDSLESFGADLDWATEAPDPVLTSPKKTDGDETFAVADTQQITEEKENEPEINTAETTNQHEAACVHSSTTVKIVTEATCTQAGEKQVICTLCNEVIETKAVPATGHSWSSWVETKKATTVSEGERERTCSKCKDKQVQVTKKLPIIKGNTIEIPSAGIYCSVYITKEICAEDIDKHDVVFMDLTKWFFPTGPAWVNEAKYSQFCGHDYKSLGDLPLAKIGTYITTVINGKTEHFKVIVSEKAVDCTVNGYNNMRGVKTGALLYEARDTETIRIYTCYEEARWLVIAEKVIENKARVPAPQSNVPLRSGKAIERQYLRKNQQISPLLLINGEICSFFGTYFSTIRKKCDTILKVLACVNGLIWRKPMKFADMKYTRPDMAKIEAEYAKATEMVKNAKKPDDVFKAVLLHEKILQNVSTAGSLASTRHSLNTEDKYYDDENNFMDEFSPLFEEKVQIFMAELLKSEFRPQAEERFSKILFINAELAAKCFSPEIVELLQTENKLVSEYAKMMASAKIPFDGKELNIPQLSAYKQKPDRSVRKAAYEAEGGFFMANAEKFDSLYDDLVKVRTEIARKLGYKSFTEVGYLRMQRNSYTPEMVSNFRRQVVGDLVPIAGRIKEMQRKRIGVDKLKMYDDLFMYSEGNPKPTGTPEQILESGRQMYHEMSPQTAEFIDYLYDNNLIDPVARKGKNVGGYCTFFPDYGSPFIFSNFNGTSADVDVLTHEAGHAFAFYSARKSEIYETAAPSLDGCEVHSMSMEFFAWPWLELYYGSDAGRARFAHLAEAAAFIPYGTQVDHFQHIMYDNPSLTPAQRNEEWKKLDKLYRPYIDCEDLPFYSDGRAWQRQSHIYEVPFYYIDYCLAQTVALSFWSLNQKNHDDAWKRYFKLVSCCGNKTFTDLCKVADIKSPFEDGCLKEVVAAAEDYLK